MILKVNIITLTLIHFFLEPKFNSSLTQNILTHWEYTHIHKQALIVQLIQTDIICIFENKIFIHNMPSLNVSYITSIPTSFIGMFV